MSRPDTPGIDVAEHARELVQAASAMAGSFRAGAALRPVGRGISAVDADHVTVEFIHPVITGKRALPASALEPDDVRFVRRGSIVLAVCLDPDPAVDATIDASAERGCMTVHLGACDPESTVVDHVVDVGSGHRFDRRDRQVTAYHLLWELVHERLDAMTATGDAAPTDLGELYPFLYEREAAAEDDVDALLAGTTAKLAEIASLRRRVLTTHADALARAAGAIARCRDRGGTVWTFGNGGSSTDARALAHLLAEAGAPAPVDARALVDDVATITALSNDVDFSVVFSRMLHSLARPGDVAVGLSTSGGSANVLAGLEAARELGVTTVGFAGYDGGAMADLDAIDELFVVPSSSVHRIQEAQTTLLHALVRASRDDA